MTMVKLEEIKQLAHFFDDESVNDNNGNGHFNLSRVEALAILSYFPPGTYFFHLNQARDHVIASVKLDSTTKDLLFKIDEGVLFELKGQVSDMTQLYQFILGQISVETLTPLSTCLIQMKKYASEKQDGEALKVADIKKFPHFYALSRPDKGGLPSLEIIKPDAETLLLAKELDLPIGAYFIYLSQDQNSHPTIRCKVKIRSGGVESFEYMIDQDEFLFGTQGQYSSIFEFEKRLKAHIEKRQGISLPMLIPLSWCLPQIDTTTKGFLYKNHLKLSGKIMNLKLQQNLIEPTFYNNVIPSNRVQGIEDLELNADLQSTMAELEDDYSKGQGPFVGKPPESRKPREQVSVAQLGNSLTKILNSNIQNKTNNQKKEEPNNQNDGSCLIM